MIKSAPLVGAYHRPPAKAILACLKTGASLMLIREPENEYDRNAIGVWVASSQIPEALYDQLELMASGFGWSKEQILETPQWKLGFIAAKTGEANQLAPELDKGATPRATLDFDLQGKPVVNLKEQAP